MTGRTAAPCGTWVSPLSAPLVAAAALRLGGIVLDGDDVYWVEGRAHEAGRNVVVRRRADGTLADVVPPTANMRTRVHEYGGAAYLVSDGVVYYSEFTDQRLYRLEPGGAPEPLTPPAACFFADAAVDPLRRRLVAVREDHRVPGREAITTLVGVPLDGPPSVGDVLVSGHDFYACPRFSRDGRSLAWLAWRHPQMPWDGTELWTADVAAEGTLGAPRLVAGGPDESIVQPGWAADGTLYFVSDRTGWWNLYRLRGDTVTAVCPMDAECGRPMWALGTTTWAFAGPSRIVVAHARQGRWRLGTIDLTTGALAPVQTDIEPGESVAATDTGVVVLGGGPGRPDAIVRIDLGTGDARTLRRSSDQTIHPGFLSEPRAIEFPTAGGLTAHAFFYAPANRDFTAPAGELPPLLVICHGGPTAAANARLNLEIQYWTSRGFAVVDVNYGGSASYGREYRRRLRGQWGVVDVADAANAVRYLVAEGLADRDRVAIRGRSAGGYTTLAALVFESATFRAGASYYGIADLELLAQDTHKFESRYLDGLIGPYPEARDLYRLRSPIEHLDRLSSPVILFQGLEDRVVPPNQAQLMADALRAKAVPVALLTFEGEQHGFRKADTIVRCLEAELTFYGAIFGFDPPPLEIDGLGGR
jgi:dipeptidyl aminopeptidase/acylaminoacyl peptidase